MSDIIVVKDAKPNGALAPQIMRYLNSNPHQHTVTEISAAVDCPEAQVIDILNNYRPHDDGTVERVPAGQGGPWLPEDIAREYRSEVESPKQLRFRWPDDTLHIDVFDQNNPAHIEALMSQRVDA